MGLHMPCSQNIPFYLWHHHTKLEMPSIKRLHLKYFDQKSGFSVNLATHKEKKALISLRKQKPGYAPQDVAAIIAQHNTQVSIMMVFAIIIITIGIIIGIFIFRRRSREEQRSTEAI